MSFFFCLFVCLFLLCRTQPAQPRSICCTLEKREKTRNNCKCAPTTGVLRTQFNASLQVCTDHLVLMTQFNTQAKYAPTTGVLRTQFNAQAKTNSTCTKVGKRVNKRTMTSTRTRSQEYREQGHQHVRAVRPQKESNKRTMTSTRTHSQEYREQGHQHVRAVRPQKESNKRTMTSTRTRSQEYREQGHQHVRAVRPLVHRRSSEIRTLGVVQQTRTLVR
jgi:hypothetical protein